MHLNLILASKKLHLIESELGYLDVQEAKDAIGRVLHLLGALDPSGAHFARRFLRHRSPGRVQALNRQRGDLLSDNNILRYKDLLWLPVLMLLDLPTGYALKPLSITCDRHVKSSEYCF